MMFLAALMLLVHTDAGAEQSKFFEDSWTERAQESMFFVLSLICLWASRIAPSKRTLALMFSGFFLVAFVRELDALLEGNIGTGSWQVIVTLIFGAMMYKLRQDWQGFKVQLQDHLETYSFGLFMAGFLTTFAFSRLLGNEELWMAVMEESYQRNVKNAVEESVELLGDALMLFSGIEFALYCRARKRDVQPESV